jgi:hypothetical protein
VPFKSQAQFRAMMAQGGKSAAVARRWARTYGVPKAKPPRRNQG